MAKKQTSKKKAAKKTTRSNTTQAKQFPVVYFTLTAASFAAAYIFNVFTQAQIAQLFFIAGIAFTVATILHLKK